MGIKKDIYAQAARLADTKGTKINAADTSRVCKCLFEAIRTAIKEERISVADAIVFFMKEIETE